MSLYWSEWHEVEWLWWQECGPIAIVALTNNIILNFCIFCVFCVFCISLNFRISRVFHFCPLSEDAAAEGEGEEKENEEQYQNGEKDDEKYHDVKEESEFHTTNNTESSTTYQEGNVKDYETIKNILRNLKKFSVKELKEKIIFYGNKQSSLEVNNFLEKAEIRKYLKGILLSKLSIADLRVLLGEEMKDQNIEEKNPGQSNFSAVSFQDVINDCDKNTIITMLLRSKNNWK